VFEAIIQEINHYHYRAEYLRAARSKALSEAFSNSLAAAAFITVPAAILLLSSAVPSIPESAQELL
jgi:hypothetical protein